MTHKAIVDFVQWLGKK